MRPEYAFLTTPERYQAGYAQTGMVETAQHRIRPLRRELRRNHFWRRFAASAWDDDATAAWHRMLPFVCRPRSFDAAVEYQPKGVRAPLRAPLRAAVVLWPFGWSSILEADLKADLTLEDLREFSEAVRSPKPQAFSLNGQPGALGDVLRVLSRGIRQDLFVDPAPDDKLAVPRHVIVTLPALSDGSLGFTYGQPTSDEMTRFSARDRARLHAALLGSEMSVPNLINVENGGGFLLVPFKAAGFAITYFDSGSLLYLGEAAFAGRKSKTLARCLSTNVRTCSLVTKALLQAIRAGEATGAPPRPNLASLATDARRNLQQLRHSYTNAFCRQLFRHYGPLAAIAKQGAESG
jgi:hypothetical protein